MSDSSPAKTLTPEQVSDITRQTNFGTWRFQKGWKPLTIADAEGCWVVDGAGKRYLDFSAQLMCVNLGHKNQRVIEAIAQQAKELCYVTPGYATEARAKLSEKLLEVLPSGLNKFFFATSGTEANEAAFKIARMVTGKNKIISRYRSYHGSTAGSLAATGDPRRWAMEPAGKMPGIFAPEVNCYDCPIKHTYPSCNIACADYVEHMIRNESNVAAAASIDFLAPAFEGDDLTAEASEVWRAGRTGIYEIKVTNQRGELIALFRGRSHRIGGAVATDQTG